MDLETINLLHDDILFVDNITDLERSQNVNLPYNAIVVCHRGKLLVEMGINGSTKVGPGQLLLIPAMKTIQPLMISTDVIVSALLISDRILKSVLGSQIDIWNKAMYLKEVYIVDHHEWMDGMKSYAETIFGLENIHLKREIMLSFLRLMLLLICEELHLDGGISSADDTRIRDKEIFNKFLEAIAAEQQKHRQVAYYANKLSITPKYLSIISQRVSGKSPTQWINDSTITDCCNMLMHTHKSVKEISYNLGFPNSSFFGQFFRRQTGMTPLEYRESYHNVGQL